MNTRRIAGLNQLGYTKSQLPFVSGIKGGLKKINNPDDLKRIEEIKEIRRLNDDGKPKWLAMYRRSKAPVTLAKIKWS